MPKPWYLTGSPDSVWASESLKRKWEPIMKATAAQERKVSGRKDAEVVAVEIPIAYVPDSMRRITTRCGCDRALVCCGVPGALEGICYRCYREREREDDAS